MIDLPEKFSKSVLEQIGLESLDDNISQIKKLSVEVEDLDYLQMFPNLEEIQMKSFPSVRKEDFEIISNLVPKLKRLYLIEQNALFEFDLSIFPTLEEIHVLHCDNLKSIKSLNKVHYIELVGNKNYTDLDSIYSAIFTNTELKLDIKYLYDIRRLFYKNMQKIDLFDRVTWVEGIGFKDHKVFEYKKYMLEELTKIFNEIYSRYIFVNDDDLFKFSTLYRWYIQNVRFENTSEKNANNVSSYYVMNYGIGNRVSYANAFNLFLNFAGIKSYIVYSIDPLDSIGMYEGKKAFSVMGSSDYALVRVVLDNQSYYVDIAWDAYALSFNKFDVAKAYLSSKEEIKKIHNIIGESVIVDSSSYHGDDADDELEMVERRLSDVDVVLSSVDSLLPAIDGKLISINFNKAEIERLKDSMELVEKDSEEYKKIQSDIISMEVEIKEDSIKLNEFKNKRNDDISKYKEFIINSYYDNDYEKLYEYGFISDYIFDLLNVISDNKNSN